MNAPIRLSIALSALVLAACASSPDAWRAPRLVREPFTNPSEAGAITSPPAPIGDSAHARFQVVQTHLDLSSVRR